MPWSLEDLYYIYYMLFSDIDDVDLNGHNNVHLNARLACIQNEFSQLIPINNSHHNLIQVSTSFLFVSFFIIKLYKLSKINPTKKKKKLSA